MSLLRRYAYRLALLAGLLCVLVWAMLAPLGGPNRDRLMEIPRGTAQGRVSHDPRAGLPATIHLTLGVEDVLLLRNNDTVAQSFGPVQILPGQQFRLPFEQVARSVFPCSAHASGQVAVIVDPTPNPGMERLRWRLAALAHAIRHYKPV
jgi:hypothetical protein